MFDDDDAKRRGQCRASPLDDEDTRHETAARKNGMRAAEMSKGRI
jgi:hypothetical protein